MRAQDSLLPDPRLYPARLRYFSYLPDEDFLVWRSQFQAVVNRYQWTNAVAKQFTFAYMKDIATQAVLDIPLSESETVEQMLDEYQDRFCMGSNSQPPQAQRRTPKIRAFRWNPLEACWDRACSRGKSLFRQRPKQGNRLTTRSSKFNGSRTDSSAVRTPVNGEPNRKVAQILPVVTEDAEGRRTMAVADDSAPASSPGLQSLLADLDSVTLKEASADGLNE